MNVIRTVDMNQIKSTSGPEITSSAAKEGILDRRSSGPWMCRMSGKSYLNSNIFVYLSIWI